MTSASRVPFRDSRGVDPREPVSVAARITVLGNVRITIRVYLFLLMAAVSMSASAQPYALGDVTIEHPWARELPPVAPNGAAYLQVRNGGGEAARIVSAHSPIAGRVEIHAHEMDAGVMKMHHLHSVEVPARGAVSFEPGGLHLMLIGLKEPLVAGKGFPLTLVFQRAGEIEVTVAITAGGAPDRSGHGNHERARTQ